MLDALRRGAATWVAKIFIAILVLSFAVWGIADIFGGYGQQTLGTVGDVEISETDYQRAYQNELRLMSNSLKRQVTPQMARNLGIESRVLTRLVAGAALDSHAGRLGLGISEQALAQTIHRDPSFHDQTGKFSRLVFDQALRNAGMSEAGYIMDRREGAVRSQLTNLIAKAPAVSNTMLNAWNQYWNAKREVSYFLITKDAAGTIETPVDETLKSYYEEHKNEFTAPEYRNISVLLVDPDLLKKDIKIEESVAKASYEANIDQYKIPEKRTIQQIPFPDKAAAEEASKKIKAGTTFEAIAKDRGLSTEEMSLGTVSKAELFDQKIAEAAFALEKDGVSDPVQGNLANVLLRVTEIKPGLTRTFEEMKKTILEKMQKEKAVDRVLDLYDAIEDGRGAGNTLKEIADKEKLPYFEYETDKSGYGTDGKEITQLTAKRAVLSAAFNSDVGVENDAEELYGGAYAWYDVAKVTPSRIRTFEEAKAKVEESWRDSEIRKKLADKAKELVEKGNKGEAIDALAQSVNAKVEKGVTFRRSDNLSNIPRSAVSMTFTMEEGKFATTPKQSGLERMVFQLNKIIPPEKLDDKNTETFTSQISDQIVDDLLAQYLTGLQNDYGLKINQQVLRRLTGGQQN